MKYLKFIPVMLAVILLTGCSASQQQKQDTVPFYYLRSELSFERSESVLAAEDRETQGEVAELLSLYLLGPESKELVSPFPSRIALVRVTQQEEYLEVILNDRLASLTGMELTLACSAMAKTCFSLTDTAEVRISADNTLLDGAKYISITTDSLLLLDESAG